MLPLSVALQLCGHYASAPLFLIPFSPHSFSLPVDVEAALVCPERELSLLLQEERGRRARQTVWLHSARKLEGESE